MPGLGISGKDGDVKISGTSIAEIRKWRFAPKANVPTYASNKTGGYKRAVAGVKSGDGALEGAWDPATPAITVIDVGTGVTLQEYINATQFYSVPAVIATFQIEVDLDEGEIVGFTADYTANGAWTNPVAALTLPDGQAPPLGDEKTWLWVPEGGLHNAPPPGLDRPALVHPERPAHLENRHLRWLNEECGEVSRDSVRDYLPSLIRTFRRDFRRVA